VIIAEHEQVRPPWNIGDNKPSEFLTRAKTSRNS
jgi:hypothetical protein